MITKYYGVFCVGDACHHFIVINSYEVEKPEIIGVDFRSDHGESLRCPKCGLVCIYSEADIVHSSSLDGKQNQRHQKS